MRRFRKADSGFASAEARPDDGRIVGWAQKGQGAYLPVFDAQRAKSGRPVWKAFAGHRIMRPRSFR